MFHWHSHMNFITLKIANKSFVEKTFVGKIFGLCALEHAHERIHYHHLCSLDFGELCCMCVYVNLIFNGWFKGFVSSVVQLRYENCLNNGHTIISHHSKYGEHIWNNDNNNNKHSTYTTNSNGIGNGCRNPATAF